MRARTQEPRPTTRSPPPSQGSSGPWVLHAECQTYFSLSSRARSRMPTPAASPDPSEADRDDQAIAEVEAERPLGAEQCDLQRSVYADQTRIGRHAEGRS